MSSDKINEEINQDIEEVKAAVEEQEGKEEVKEEIKEKEDGAGEDKEKAVEEQSEKSAGEEKKKPSPMEELNDKMMRTLAEFENFRKRSEREKAQMFEVGAKSVIEKILPVIDNFERGLAAISEEEKQSPFAEGINMVYKQMLGVFDEIGVKPIEAVGTEFNPDFHNAVMMVDDDSFESNMVCEELQKGYMYKDSVVRHSMVKVAN